VRPGFVRARCRPRRQFLKDGACVAIDTGRIHWDRFTSAVPGDFDDRRFVGVDPGISNLVACSEMELLRRDEMVAVDPAEDRRRPQWRVRTREWRHDAGITSYTRWAQVRRRGSRDSVDRTLQLVPHRNTSYLERYVAYLRVLYERKTWRLLWLYHSCKALSNRRFQKRRKEQSAMDRLVERLTHPGWRAPERKHRGRRARPRARRRRRRPAVIAFGRGGGNLAAFGKVHGGVKGPCKRLMERASHKAIVVSSDEFRTSAVCALCRGHWTCYAAPATAVPPHSISSSSSSSKAADQPASHGSKNLCCPNSPNRFWNRDVGASYSIGWRCRRTLLGEAWVLCPAATQRGKARSARLLRACLRVVAWWSATRQKLASTPVQAPRLFRRCRRRVGSIMWRDGVRISRFVVWRLRVSGFREDGRRA